MPQPVLSAMLLHVDVLVPGWQLWHALVGLGALAPKKAPPISQPLAHTPVWQISPAAQEVPSVTGVQFDVLRPGWQLSHALAGSGVLAA